MCIEDVIRYNDGSGATKRICTSVVYQCNDNNNHNNDRYSG